MDPAAVPGELARVRAGTRIRLFWLEQEDRYAASGTLLNVDSAHVTIAPDDGGKLAVPLSAVNCFYVPRPYAGHASRFASLRAALRRLGPRGRPAPLARRPEEPPPSPSAHPEPRMAQPEEAAALDP
jgi:hypothetical protein